MFIYPENLKAKPMLWLWLLRDIAVIGIGALLSVLALTQGLGMGLLVVTVLYAFLTIQVDGSSILDSCAAPPVFSFCGSNTMNGGWTHEPKTEKRTAPAAVDPAAHGHRPCDAPTAS